eukprot:1144786-Pelagomonas_calceolata.AAC.2
MHERKHLSSAASQGTPSRMQQSKEKNLPSQALVDPMALLGMPLCTAKVQVQGMLKRITKHSRSLSLTVP